MKRPPRFLRLAALALGALLAAGGARAADPKPADALAGQLERIFEKKDFEARKFGPSRWMEGGRAYTTLEPSAAVGEAKDIVRYDTATGARRVLVAASALVPAAGQRPLEIDDYAWSKDGKRLLIFTNTKKVWRRKTRGDYWVLDVAGGRFRKLGGGAPDSTLMFAKFSPDGGRVAYVRANDIWVEDLETGKITRLTLDGSATIINGTADWVYEEEFGVRDGFRWSPDGQTIAYWHFDTSGVGDFSLINDTDTTYPAVTKIQYPTVGTVNSAVRIEVVPAAGGTPRGIALPGHPREHYVPRMEWVESTGEIVLQQMNRLQNSNDVYLADAKTGQVRRMLHDEDKAWVDVVDEWQWLPGKDLLWVSEQHGWRHAYAAPRDATPMRLLTPGDFDILSVDGVDEKGGLLYFIASPDDATRRYLYRARLDGKGAPVRVTPLAAPGTHAYDIAPDGRYALHTFSTIDRPPVVDLVRLPSHEVVRVLEDNKALAAAVAPFTTPAAEFFQVTLDDGVRMDGWMFKPRTFDPSKKYPLLMYVYGEPAGAEVTDRWHGDRALFHRALTDAGYVVACVDNRGTPAPKGRAWRKIIYGSVGVLASKEQAAAVRKLLAERPYLDGERVASWGWSGGGSMTLNLLFRSPELYKVGMSVAPVPDQLLYDTIYQERYMGLPRDNAEGYKNGSPISFAEGLQGKLLLVHGSGDDNVHFQGSERLVNRMIALGKPFQFMDYPNRTHAINEGEGTSLHLHTLLSRFLMENLPAGPRKP
ncbi:MAG TPA: S9 family peptidase [Thermoanaerobaculia bacterium]|jgi:dipeptidyl-peptidase-4|nr:S9 family peptidase [Thermoanaerobaculia bacterium]